MSTRSLLAVLPRSRPETRAWSRAQRQDRHRSRARCEPVPPKYARLSADHAPAAQPRLRAAADGPAPVERRDPVHGHRLPAAGPGPHPVGRRCRHRGLHPLPGTGAVDAARRAGRRPPVAPTADDRRRRAPPRRPGRPGRGRPDPSRRPVGHCPGRLRGGERLGGVRRGPGRRPPGRRGAHPAAGRGRHADGAAGRGAAGRAAPGRGVVRPGPGPSLPRRRRLLSGIHRFAPGHAHPVPGGTPARPGPVAPPYHRGLPLPVGHPYLRTTALLLGVGSFIGPGVLLAIVVIGRRQGLSPGALGGLVAVFGASVLVGAVISPAIRRALAPRAVLLLELWTATACGLFLVWPNVYVLAASIVPTAVVIPSSDAVVHGYRIAM